MQPRHILTAEGRSLARAQAGVLSTAQLRALGFSYRSLDRAARDWTRLARGVYLLTDAVGEAPWAARVWAGVLMGGSGAAAAGPTAAVLHGLLSLGELAAGKSYLPVVALRADTEIHVLTPLRRVEPRPGYVFMGDASGARLPARPSDPPRTGIDDTVLDLCAAGPPRDAVTWVSRACQRRLTTEHRLLARLAARSSVRHSRLVRHLLADVAAGATTELERRVMREVFVRHGLPAGCRQHRTRARGRIVDIAVRDFALLIELDGKIGHVEEGAFRDRRRDNGHAVLGWTTLRYGWWEACGSPCECALEIASALRDRGWTGEFLRCSGCAR